jgi:hypothetical protein
VSRIAKYILVYHRHKPLVIIKLKYTANILSSICVLSSRNIFVRQSILTITQVINRSVYFLKWIIRIMCIYSVNTYVVIQLCDTVLFVFVL